MSSIENASRTFTVNPEGEFKWESIIAGSALEAAVLYKANVMLHECGHHLQYEIVEIEVWELGSAEYYTAISTPPTHVFKV